jgi:hypothetical protein
MLVFIMVVARRPKTVGVDKSLLFWYKRAVLYQIYVGTKILTASVLENLPNCSSINVNWNICRKQFWCAFVSSNNLAVSMKTTQQELVEYRCNFASE